MRKFFHIVLLFVLSLLASAQAPLGNNYEVVPFRKNLFESPYGAGGLAEYHLYWKAAPPTTQDINEMRPRLADLEDRNMIPTIGMQGWGDNYFNAWKVKNDPSLASSDPYRNFTGLRWETFVDFLEDHPKYVALDINGNRHFDNNADRGRIEHLYVSPNMPLEPDDIPFGSNNPTNIRTYGDWMAEQYGELAGKLGGIRGVMLSDYYDSSPYGWLDYNPRIVKDFLVQTGLTISGAATTKDSCNYILSNYKNEWYDFFCESYANFWGRMVESMQEHHPKKWPAIIIGQCEFAIAHRRSAAVDFRILAKRMGADRAIYGWDSQRMVGHRKNYAPESCTPSLIGIAAAYEPGIYHGANMECEINDFWDGIVYNFPKLTEGKVVTASGVKVSEVQQELGLKRLKRLWLETAWGHIADSDGNVRRAISYFERYYWDAGKINADIQNMYNSLYPAKAFGPAIYYSETLQRLCEKKGYMYLQEFNQEIYGFRENGVACNYYVSDRGVKNMKDGAKPAYWIIPVRSGITVNDLSAEEKAALEAIAPIIPHTQAVAYGKENNPLQFEGGNYRITGYGFYDNHDRLIVSVSDQIRRGETNNELPATEAKITIKLEKNGRYHATELFTNEVINFDVKIGVGVINAELDRWDTKVFTIELDEEIAEWGEDNSNVDEINFDKAISFYEGVLRFSPDVTSFQVYNIAGILLKSGFNETVNLDKGIYIVKAKINDDVITGKLIW